jgi:Na+/H+ antiporter NhaD/arsenite permease-like protein
MSFWITLVIVILIYVGIAIGHWPRLQSNRATVALIGVGVLIVTGQIRFENLVNYLNLDTLILLFSMMVLNANLRLAGFFHLSANRLLGWARGPRTLLAIEIVLTGVLSAFFLNDTICLMFTPLIVEIALAMERNPIPYLIALATASNIGSVATLTGNPQNMIIGITSGISYLDFMAHLAPVALLGLGSIWIVLVRLYPYEFKNKPFARPFAKPMAFYRPLLIKSLAITAGLLVAFLIGVPIAEAALLAACALLITRRIKPEKVLGQIDWGILVFFAALFIVTGTIEANGISAELIKLAKPLLGGNIINLSIVTVFLSNLVSNVPAVLLLRSVIPLFPDPHTGWLTLAAASTLAGNLTLLGSVANLIVAEVADRYRVELDFWEYTRAGLIITLLSLLTGITWIYLFVR